MSDTAQFSSHADRVVAAAAAAGDDVLLTDDHGSVTGTEFAAEVNRLSRALAELGCGRGSRVGIAAGVSIPALAVRYAAGLLGSATVFCPETADRFGAFVAIVRPDLTVVRRRSPSEPLVTTCGRTVDLDSLARSSAISQAVDPTDGFAGRSRPDDLAVLISSGGTTGRPKASRRSFAGYLGLVTAEVNPARRQLVCTPLAYVAQVLVDQTLLGGGRVVLQDGFDPAAVLLAIETERITHVGLVEPLLARLVDHPDRAHRDLSSLQAVTHIGATAPAPLRRRWLEALGPVLVNPYGSSECGIATVLTAPDYGLTDDGRLASAGRALPGAVVRVERTGGTTAEADELGRVVVRTSGTACGYVGETPEDAFRPDGWFASGDLGSLDQDGYLTIRGRAADERVVGGLSIMPIDLENALYAHPQVRYVAAVPLDTDPHLPFGAVVTVARGSRLRAAELTGWVARWDPALAPAALAVLDEVPVTEQGKPDRAAIADLISVGVCAA